MSDDDERNAITAAMQRLLAGRPLRSSGDLTIVALAEEAGCEMITADERLVNALGSRFPVRWLGGMRF